MCNSVYSHTCIGSTDYVNRAIKNRDPPDLRISTPDDQFPDPKLDVDGFMRYCGESYSRLTAYLWLVTREMIESGVEIKPIGMHEPFILSKSVSIYGSMSGISKCEASVIPSKLMVFAVLCLPPNMKCSCCPFLVCDLPHSQSVIYPIPSP